MRPPAAHRGLRGRLLGAVGVPDEESDLGREVDRLGLNHRVTRRPFSAEVGGVLRALDVVVFPNQGAGLGRPVLEASAYGVPVVASGSKDGGGVIEPGNTAFLVERGEVRQLADALRQLLQDPELRARLGEAAARKAKLFAPDRVAPRVEEVWKRVLGR